MSAMSPENFPSIRIAVTGGRDFNDHDMVHRALDIVHAIRTVAALAHGGARGADKLAHEWADANGVPVTPFVADWGLGRKGGPVRNRRMLTEFKPDAVIAFPGNKGTRDCCEVAEKMGIPILAVTYHPSGGGRVRLEGALP